jgi:hypothetical protein
MIEGLHHDTSISLNFVNEVTTLDFGYEVGGFLHLEVSYVSSPVQVEVEYSELFIGLGFDFSDGPYTFANRLSGTFRVETFNLTERGVTESFFIQGGLRWMTIRLLTPGSITFSKLGLRATIAQTDVDDLPGSFQCSNQNYNEIWKLGARAVTATCVDTGTQVST